MQLLSHAHGRLAVHEGSDLLIREAPPQTGMHAFKEEPGNEFMLPVIFTGWELLLSVKDTGEDQHFLVLP